MSEKAEAFYWYQEKGCLVSWVLWSQYSLLHPVCYILGCGSIVFIVVEELAFPRRHGEKQKLVLYHTRL